MQFSLFLVGLIASAVSAQIGPAACVAASAKIPLCGRNCITTHAMEVGCANGDLACYCAKQPQFESKTITCSASACKAAEIADVVSGSKAVCECMSKPKM